MRDGDRWRRQLQDVAGLEGIGFGNPVRLVAGRDKIYGRELPLATIPQEHPGQVQPVKWLRKVLAKAPDGPRIEIRQRGAAAKLPGTDGRRRAP